MARVVLPVEAGDAGAGLAETLAAEGVDVGQGAFIGAEAGEQAHPHRGARAEHLRGHGEESRVGVSAGMGELRLRSVLLHFQPLDVREAPSGWTLRQPPA